MASNSMSNVFLLHNQHQYFLAKDKSWVDGREPQVLYKTRLKDEALNQLFEANTQDADLRIQLVECPLNSKGLPEIDPAWLPPIVPAEPKSHNCESKNNEDQPVEP